VQEKIMQRNVGEFENQYMGLEQKMQTALGESTEQATKVTD